SAVGQDDAERDRGNERALGDAGIREELLAVIAEREDQDERDAGEAGDDPTGDPGRTVDDVPPNGEGRAPESTRPTITYCALSDDDRLAVVTVVDAVPLPVSVLLNTHLDTADRNVRRHVALQLADLQHLRSGKRADLAVQPLNRSLRRSTQLVEE